MTIREICEQFNGPVLFNHKFLGATTPQPKKEMAGKKHKKEAG
jgi:hypothetical protein